MTLQDLEDRRLELQEQLDAEKTNSERNEQGQFATPPALARQITSEALCYLNSERVRFLDPALGSGSFYSALLDQVPVSRISDEVGIELDPRFADAAKDLWEDRSLEVVEADFTDLNPGSYPDANLLVTNPPYVRHHHLEKREKNRLKSVVRERLGLKPSGLSGLYVYFLLLSHDWMEEGGVAAWLIPSEWMDVNYGSVVREYLTERVELLRVHTFDASDVQFGDALVSSSVVIFRRNNPSGDHSVSLTSGRLESPEVKFELRQKDLRQNRKWSPVLRSEGSYRAHSGTTLEEYLTVKRGIATGRNNYFIRPLEEWRELGVDERFLRPILPSGSKLEGRVIEVDDNGYPALPEPLAVLDCDVPRAEIKEECPALWEYLQGEEASKAKQSYLASRRTPWYSQESRDTSPFIWTYMGRSNDGDCPFRVLVNRSDAVAKNSLHQVYVKGALARYLGNNENKYIQVAIELENIAAESYLDNGRVYGGGLHKLEPGEIESLPAERLEKEFELRPSPQRKAEQIEFV